MAENSQSEGRESESVRDYGGTSQALKPLLIVGAVVLVAALLFGEPFTVAEVPPTGSGDFNELAVLSGIKKRDLSEFSGGKASAVMGGVDIDLRSATMQSDEVILHVSSVMGGVKIRVPDDWTVVSRVNTILGGYKDDTHHPREQEHRLVLDGTVFMGGLQITN